jgi:lysyl endopeptidase
LLLDGWNLGASIHPTGSLTQSHPGEERIGRDRGGADINKNKVAFVAAAVIVALSAIARPAHAAAPVVLTLDLPKLIDEAAKQPERFAVDVTQHVALANDGVWSTSGANSVWRYSLKVPEAVSLSFHAARFALPASAVLKVTGSRASISYRAGDASRGGLWSRPLVGDSLELTVTVATAEVAKVALDIDSVQVGYRGFGGLPSHPHFARMAAATTLSTQSCIENFSCDATAGNQPSGHATVAVLIGNQFQCTGTLLNDTSGDQLPYVLTARHCENGKLGGGAPLAAGSVTVYWDAVSPCGAALGSIYDGAAPAQAGAVTVVEEQDAWLIKLDHAPVASNAYWAGWDATGGAFTGGYSVHHALGFDQQYVAWYGQSLLTKLSAATLSIGYDSTFWGVVNQLGSIGAGASGGGLFDPANHLVGSGSLAALQNGPNSAGSCPVNPPAAPTASTVTAMYTAFSAVFASTADTTSTTGSRTIQSVLDANGTGKLVIDGTGVLPLTLSADQTSLTTFAKVTLTWNAPAAASCTASGGVAGDGWAGTKAASGTATLANLAGGTVSYFMNCTKGNLTGHARVDVQWTYQAALISLNISYSPVALGGPFYLNWDANVSPCVASGGMPGDGWAGTKSNPGTQTIIGTQLGDTTYTLTCGTGVQSATTSAVATVLPVAVTMTADSTQIRAGSYAQLSWHSPGANETCDGTGGSAGNPWNQQIALGGSGSFPVTEQAAGTYTYTINCTGGGQTATSSATIVFTNDAPLISLSAVSPTQQVYAGYQPAIPLVDLLWSANVTGCLLLALGPVGNTAVTLLGQYPNGNAADVELLAGLYTYQLNCGAYQATTTIQWTTPTPKVTLTAPTTTWVAHTPYQLWWTTNTEPCTQSGGAPGDGWAGTTQAAGQVATFVTESVPGTYTFVVSCGTGGSAGQAQLSVTVPPPAVTIGASTSSIPVGGVVTLTWNSSIAPCTSVDPAGVNWGGNDVGAGGSIPVIEVSAGTFTYAITCGSGSQTVHASTTITVVAAPPTSIAASTNSATVGTPVTLTWTSGDSSICTANGGSGSDGWAGTMGATGTATVTSTSTGSLAYGITCDNGSAQTQVNYTAPSGVLASAPTPSATLSANATTLATGQKATISWISQSATGCLATGGSAGDGWSGTLGPSGTLVLSESVAGSYTYGITCTGAPPAAQAQVTINFSTSSSGGGSGGGSNGGGGGGGGGEFDFISLLLLAALPLIRKSAGRSGGSLKS